MTSSLIALVGNPNTGKTALFNALTGSHQKVANYPGVTVERKEGLINTPSGQKLTLLDLPGAYTLDAKTLDEQVTRDAILGRLGEESHPCFFIAVADATNLERSLSFVLELKERNLPLIVVLNMMDLAKNRGLKLDLEILSKELGAPVIPTVAVKNQGLDDLLKAIEEFWEKPSSEKSKLWHKPTPKEIHNRYAHVDHILKKSVRKKTKPSIWTDRIDRVVLHPFWGSLLLILFLTLMFQSVFSLANWPMDGIKTLVETTHHFLNGLIPEGALKNLILDGILSGVGSVLVFLPQILILFFFIILLEDSGYMARAAFLMDKLMSRVGLHGRAFIPLLSSHACAIPGIMATRTIENREDRLATILVAPLTTCSARLPVYSLLIAAFIPNKNVGGFLSLQGLVMMGLYAAGIISALIVGWILKKTVLKKGGRPILLLELPTYKIPSFRNMSFGLIERARIFLKRAGTLILGISILLWFVSSYPKPPTQATTEQISTKIPAINYSLAGRLGHWIEPIIKPIGFDWRIGTGLIPGFAAREVMVSALSTVFAVEGDESVLGKKLSQQWGLPTALSLLVWYIFAPQCMATLAVVRRETNSWKWPFFLLSYMLSLAYLGSFITFQVTRLFL